MNDWNWVAVVVVVVIVAYLAKGDHHDPPDNPRDTPRTSWWMD